MTKLGFAMETRTVQHPVHKYAREAGISGASVHTLRHTIPTNHVAKCTSLRTVQELLGHASLKTTSIYVQLARERQPSTSDWRLEVGGWAMEATSCRVV